MTDIFEHRPERLKAAIVAACRAEAGEDEDNDFIECHWPDCPCLSTPAATKAAIQSWVDSHGEGGLKEGKNG